MPAEGRSEERAHRLNVPMSTEERRKLGVEAAERFMSAGELARRLLRYGLEHLDEIEPRTGGNE